MKQQNPMKRMLVLAAGSLAGVKDKETVNVPVWAGVAAIVVGGALLFVPTKA